MKKLTVLILSSVVFIGCAKEIARPATTSTERQPLEHDQNFFLSSLNATRSGDSLEVSFNTAWEKKVVSLDVMKGTSTSQFCRIQTLEAKGSVAASQPYHFTDRVNPGDT